MYLNIYFDTAYIVFGEFKYEDLNAQAQANAAEALKAQDILESGVGDDSEAPELADEDEEGDVDESGMEAKDIELVMQQASVSRAKAVKALRENDFDIVNAIMGLTVFLFQYF